MLKLDYFSGPANTNDNIVIIILSTFHISTIDQTDGRKFILF